MARFDSDQLILLLSQPRAGSTLLQRLLAGNPEIHTVAEPWLMLHPVYAMRPTGHSADYGAEMAHRALMDFLGTLHEGRRHYDDAVRKMALHLYGTACAQAGKARFLDKTPRYFLIIAELIRIFPDARFVFLLRNPLAVLASILNTWVKGDWLRLSRHDSNLIAAPALLAEGMDLLGDRAIKVHYEHLVASPEPQLARLCADLGLDYHPEMLHYGSRSAPVGRYGDPTGVERYTRPSNENVDRWLAMGEWNQTRHLAQEYLRVLGPHLLAKLGYDSHELAAKLESVECQRGGLIAHWPQIFPQKMTTLDKLALITITLIQRRDLRYSTQVLKVMAGRL